MTADEREIIQGVMDDVHGQFIDAVARGRGMDPTKIRDLADGRIFSGQQAKKLGLVDEMGNFEDAIKTASKLAGIRGEPRIVEKKPEFSLRNLLTGQSSLAGLVGLSGLQGIPIWMHKGQSLGLFQLSYLYSF
jgi:protease-4